MLIRKKYIEKILKHQNTASVTVLTGVRYCGKSTLLRQAYDELIKRGIPLKNIEFIDFRKRGYKLEENRVFLSNFIDSFMKNVNGTKYLFIDNIELVDDWGHILHYQCKYNYNLNVYIAPVNSNFFTNINIAKIAYLHKIKILPFSFQEFIEYIELNSKEKLKTISEEELFEEYQKYGGLPEVLESRDIQYKHQIIEWSYIDTLNQNTYMLYFKDFAKSLMKYLVETIGEEFSCNIFQTFVNRDSCGNFHIFNLSYELLTHYMSLLSNTELIEVCGDVDLIKGDLIWQDHKYYVSDSSFYFSCPNSFKELNSKGILESIVFCEFLRRDYKVKRGVLDNDDITFVHTDSSGITFIQIETSLEDKKIRKKTFDKLNQVTGLKYVISTDKTDYSCNDIKQVNILDFLKDNNLITIDGD